MKEVFGKLWKGGKDTFINEVSDNRFIIEFSSEEARDRVLKKGPWIFDNNLLLLKPWEATTGTDYARFEDLEVWVQIKNLPIFLRTEEDVKRAKLDSPVQPNGNDKREKRDGNTDFKDGEIPGSFDDMISNPGEDMDVAGGDDSVKGGQMTVFDNPLGESNSAFLGLKEAAKMIVSESRKSGDGKRKVSDTNLSPNPKAKQGEMMIPLGISAGRGRGIFRERRAFDGGGSVGRGSKVAGAFDIDVSAGQIQNREGSATKTPNAKMTAGAVHPRQA